MTKISPTDKIFDELIPDSPEYWEAIENIDCRPKHKRGLFWHWIKGCFVGEEEVGEEEKAPVATTYKSETFTLKSLADIPPYLLSLYPECKFNTSWNSELLEIRSKEGNFAAHISLRLYAYWTEQEYKDFLSQVRCAVYSIRDKQSRLYNDVRMRSFQDDIESGRRRL